ncbi:MAG: hypothetical protein OXK76_05450 [Gammaproteobacteria bacterium]|nr:hypothetical protein [Gammaproteobacteria bacterium]
MNVGKSPAQTVVLRPTMGAAVARVLGIVGIVGAFGAAAAPDHPFAAESLSGDAPYSITATPVGDIVLDFKLDTSLESNDDYYLVVNFWSAQLTQDIEPNEAPIAHRPDVAGTSGSDVGVTPVVAPREPMLGEVTGFRFYSKIANVQGNPTATPPVTAVNGEYLSCAGTPADVNNTNPCLADINLVRAFRGEATDSAGVYKIELAGEHDIPIDTRVRLALGEGRLAIDDVGAATYRGDLFIYRSLGHARAAARATDPVDVPDTYLVHGYGTLFEVAPKIAAPTITPMLATADVGYPERNVSTGGPFRVFTRPSTDVGVLARVTLNVKADDPATMVDESVFLDASDGEEFEGTVNTAARVVVTSDTAGAFGFGNGAGDGPNGERRRTGDNPATPTIETDAVLNAGGSPQAFRVGPVPAEGQPPSCTGAALTLRAPDADGDLVAINPTADTDPTFSAAATQGIATVVGGGPFQFCVNVGTNEVAIPAVGDDRMLDGYLMTVTPMSGPATARVNGPEASGPAGAIARNGTTVNISYLSTNLAYNQRLVIVNHGTRDAGFWMDDFQTEEGVAITGSISGTVKPRSRMVVRVQDMLDSSDEARAPRASGILSLTAPRTAVDVMTIQENLGTGQLDTTTY